MRSWILTLLFAVPVACACGPASGGTVWRTERIEGGACGNGSPYRVAVSAGTAPELLIVLESGGACWDDFRCNDVRVASHTHHDLDAEAVVERAQTREDLLFSRDPARSPFAAATFVAMPYCTGDLHLGDEVHAYVSGSIHHVGARNVAGTLAIAHALVPDVERVWLVGLSAGGFGATVAWEQARAAFPSAEVHVLSDSGAAFVVPDAIWATMRDAWSPVVPAGCTGCDASLSAIIDHNLTSADGHARFGLMHHTSDTVTRAYLALSPAWLESALREWQSRFAGSSSHRAFLSTGGTHLVLEDPDASVNGTSARRWVFSFARGERWENVGP